MLFRSGVVFLFAKGWLDDGIPGEDFAGNVAHVQELLDAAARQGTVGPWADRWFLGQPRTLLFARQLGALIPSAFWFLGPVGSIKFALALFQFFAGLSMWALLGDVVRRRSARWLGAILYAVHPMVIVETAQRGHMEVSLFYFAAPLVFWIGRLARRWPTGRLNRLTGE